MKTVLIFLIALCLYDISGAEDNGQYRPENFSKQSQYWSNYDNRYYDNNYLDRYQNFYGRNSYYPNSFGNYQPSYYNNIRPYQQSWAPFSNFGKDYRVNDLLNVPKSVPTTRAPIAVTSTTTASPITTPASKQTVLPKLIQAKYPLGNEGYARIVEQDSDIEANGYHFKYQTENGISAAETGVVGSNSRAGTSVKGFYEYVGDDGKLYRVDYTADENGFHPTGAHLP